MIKKENISVEDNTIDNLTKEKELIKKLRKKYKILKILFGILFISFLGLVYINYDYMVFKILIAGNYVFTDCLDEIYSEAVGEKNFKGYLDDFDKVVIETLTDRIREKNGDRYTYLYTPEQYDYSKEYVKSDAKLAEIIPVSEDIIYTSLPNISKGTREFIYDNVDEFKKYKNIIIDLRGNYGGMLSDYYKISDLFLDKNVTIGYENTRLPFLNREIKTKKKKYLEFENIFILQDESTASSAEGLIMSLKENLDNVTIIGTKSFGKGIGQVTIPLTGGYAVKATILTLQTPNSYSIHKVGINPDIIYKRDDILKHTIEIIEENN